MCVYCLLCLWIINLNLLSLRVFDSTKFEVLSFVLFMNEKSPTHCRLQYWDEPRQILISRWLASESLTISRSRQSHN